MICRRSHLIQEHAGQQHMVEFSQLGVVLGALQGLLQVRQADGQGLPQPAKGVDELNHRQGVYV